MNRLYSLFFLYWIVRDTGTPKDPTISIGFMRQTSAPWRTGKGIQIRISKYIFQVGMSKRNKSIDPSQDELGLLYAMQGRLLGDAPKDIGSW